MADPCYGMVPETECNYWKRETQRLTEAIVDALADMHPGHAPYSLLANAIKPEDQRA